MRNSKLAPTELDTVDDDTTDRADNPHPERVRCETCLLRGIRLINKTSQGTSKYLCRHEPPTILVDRGSYKPVLPIVRATDYCAHWIDRETRESYDTVMKVT